MAAEDGKRDQNRKVVMLVVTNDSNKDITQVRCDPVTLRLLTNATITGTVTPTVADDFEGAPVTVGTAAVELTFGGTTSAMMIQSDPDNTGKVWIGKSNVDNTGANAMAQLEKGDSLEIDLDDTTNAIYAVSDTATQNVFKMALV